MAETSMTSAVALPDSDHDIAHPDGTLKRRQSIRENRDSDNKRRRLSLKDKNHPSPTQDTPATHTTSKDPEAEGSRRKSGAVDERKRGKRLFGSLLGTLSQTSTSATQRRRADIEKKQQDKLKSQDTEYHEEKRKKHEELMEARRKEQKVYNRQAMELQHSNKLSMAHFLQTKAEPMLYYKPWQLRPEEESKIEKQIEETKTVISKNIEEFDLRNPPTPPANPEEETPAPSNEAPADGTQASTGTEERKDIATNSAADTGTVGAEINSSDQQEQFPDTHPNPTDTGTNNDTSPDNKPPDEENEEVMLQDNEDTVIY